MRIRVRPIADGGQRPGMRRRMTATACGPAFRIKAVQSATPAGWLRPAASGHPTFVESCRQRSISRFSRHGFAGLCQLRAQPCGAGCGSSEDDTTVVGCGACPRGVRGLRGAEARRAVAEQARVTRAQAGRAPVHQVGGVLGLRCDPVLLPSVQHVVQLRHHRPVHGGSGCPAGPGERTGRPGAAPAPAPGLWRSCCPASRTRCHGP